MSSCQHEWKNSSTKGYSFCPICYAIKHDEDGHIFRNAKEALEPFVRKHWWQFWKPLSKKAWEKDKT